MFAKKRLCLTKIKGDGDCFFTAIQKQIYGNKQLEKDFLRRKLVQYYQAACTQDDYYKNLIRESEKLEVS